MKKIKVKISELKDKTKVYTITFDYSNEIQKSEVERLIENFNLHVGCITFLGNKIEQWDCFKREESI